MESYPKFRNALLISALALVLSLLGHIYINNSTATAAALTEVRRANEKQDEKLDLLILAVERLKTIAEQQTKTNDRNEDSRARDAAAARNR